MHLVGFIIRTKWSGYYYIIVIIIIIILLGTIFHFKEFYFSKKGGLDHPLPPPYSPDDWGTAEHRITKKKKRERTLYSVHVNVRTASTLILWTQQQYANGHHNASTLRYKRHTGVRTQHFKGLWQKYFIPCTLGNHRFCNLEWKLTTTVRNRILSVSLISSPVCSFKRLRWSRGSVLAFKYPSSRVQTRPKPLDF